MDFDQLKKGMWTVAILIGVAWYISANYTFHDALKFSRQRPNPDVSPVIDYYAGMAMFIKEDYDGAITAFNQLLTDYPTCQYAPTAMYRLAAAYIERNRFQEAREVLDKYFEDHPKDKRRPDAEKKYEYIKFK